MAPTKICDHKSVGMIIRKNNSILLIERGRPPFGFAAPAGHVDDKGSFENAAIEETKEEVGLDVTKLKLLKEGRKENRCRRQDGDWHYWKIYEVLVSGEITRSEGETKQAGWYNEEDLGKLINKTQKYLQGDVSEEDWVNSPGLEPIWYEWFKELNLVH